MVTIIAAHALWAVLCFTVFTFIPRRQNAALERRRLAGQRRVERRNKQCAK
jgi:hypothetical protein